MPGMNSRVEIEIKRVAENLIGQVCPHAPSHAVSLAAQQIIEIAAQGEPTESDAISFSVRCGPLLEPGFSVNAPLRPIVRSKFSSRAWLPQRLGRPGFSSRVESAVRFRRRTFLLPIVATALIVATAAVTGLLATVPVPNPSPKLLPPPTVRYTALPIPGTSPTPSIPRTAGYTAFPVPSASPTMLISQAAGYTIVPDMTGVWELDFKRTNFGNTSSVQTYTIALSRIPDSKCSTTLPCYGGPWFDVASRQSQGGQFKVTFSLKGDQLDMNATDADEFGRQSYKASAPDNGARLPRFTGTFRENNGGLIEVATFTFFRIS